MRLMFTTPRVRQRERIERTSRRSVYSSGAPLRKSCACSAARISLDALMLEQQNAQASSAPARRGTRCIADIADFRFELRAGSAALLRPVFMASPRPLLPAWLKAAEDKQSVRVQAVIVRSAVAPDRIPSCLPRAPAPCSIAGGPAMAWRSGRLAAIRFSARCRSDRCSSIRYKASCRSCCARLALRIVRV